MAITPVYCHFPGGQNPALQQTKVILLLLLHYLAISLGFTILGAIFAYVIIFFNPTIEGSRIPSSWMVHAGGVFVAGIYTSRTCMSGSFESVRWNACVHRLDLSLYSHAKEFLGNGVRNHVNSKGKISTGKILLSGGSTPQHCIKQDSKSNTLPVSYSGPLTKMSDMMVSTLQNHWSILPVFTFGATLVLF